jgi:alkanesulfonate monooxygenase SsuD/methylene tetrahydromethanopterin reductase-like flavin-dependent oxidoreductase (luciferase family)
VVKAQDMKLGLFTLMGLHDQNTSPAAVVKTAIDMVRMADDFGFDIAWFAEHQFTAHSICPSSLMMLARCVSETRQIRLGTALFSLPLHNPLRLVQEVAFAELLAGGRLVLGLGSGCQYQEFSRFGIRAADAARITMEMWDVLEQSLATGYVGYEGRFVRMARTALAIRPIALSLPEIFVAGSHPDIVAKAALRGCTPFMSFGHRGLMWAELQRDILAERWQMGGGLTATMPLALQRHIFVTDDAGEARHVAACLRDLTHAVDGLNWDARPECGAGLWSSQFGEEPDCGDLSAGAIIGAPAYCVERLQQEIEALRPTHLACTMGFEGIGRQQTLASLERFGCEVIPQLGTLVTMHERA